MSPSAKEAARPTEWQSDCKHFAPSACLVQIYICLVILNHSVSQHVSLLALILNSEILREFFKFSCNSEGDMLHNNKESWPHSQNSGKNTCNASPSFVQALNVTELYKFLS